MINKIRVKQFWEICTDQIPILIFAIFRISLWYNVLLYVLVKVNKKMATYYFDVLAN
jgi:hypothetical protein